MSKPDYHQSLLSRKAELEAQINRRRDILTTPLSEATDELSAYDQHPGDVASDTFEREKELGLLQMLQAELDQVHRALDDVQKGAYGICDQCGMDIQPARLQRLPHTNLCSTCAQNQSNVFNRPAEEDIIRYGIAFMPDWDIAGYDYDQDK